MKKGMSFPRVRAPTEPIRALGGEVLGASMLARRLRHTERHFNPAGARSQATMLTPAAIALILPAAFQAAPGVKTIGLSQLEQRENKPDQLSHLACLEASSKFHLKFQAVFVRSRSASARVAGNCRRLLLWWGRNILLRVGPRTRTAEACLLPGP
jgi:hypothetical protein